jgi:hypothetical protein
MKCGWVTKRKSDKLGERLGLVESLLEVLCDML